MRVGRRILSLSLLAMAGCGFTHTYKQETINTPSGEQTVLVGVTEPTVVHYDAKGKPLPPTPMKRVAHQVNSNGGTNTVYTLEPE